MATAAAPTKSSAGLMTTMAILLANYDAARDYLSNFEPFVVDRLKHWPAGEEPRPKRIGQALSDAYNLPSIPINTVTQLRDRARRDGYLIEGPGGRLYPNPEALAKVPSLAARRTVFLDHFEWLTDSIHEYATAVHDRPWTREDAEEALEGFAEEFSIELAMARREGAVDGEPVSNRDEKLAIAHSFARRALEGDERSLDYLEEAVQASMLANVIYLQELASWKPDLGSLVVYLDTPVIFRILGLTDDEVAEASRQMVDLLAEFEVPVRIFDHTETEVIGVLRRVERSLREADRGKTDLDRIFYQEQDVLSHALRRGWGPADMQEVISELPARLARERIAVAPAPSLDRRLRTDEDRLHKILGRLGFTPEQRKADFQSLHAIHQLREGRSAAELGRARAIFVTSNDSLVKSGRLWFAEQGLTSVVPQCTTETSFTTQLWLRRPEGRPHMAKKFLAAESFAALNPAPELWERYLDRIADRRRRDEITEQQVRALVFSIEAREGLIEVVHGDPDRVNDRTIGEVLQRYERRVPEAFAEELESTQQDVEALRSENESMRAQIAGRDRRLHDQAGELATQNRELAALQKKLDRLIGSEDRRAQLEAAVARRRGKWRKAAGAIGAVACALAAVAVWLFAGLDSAVLRGAVGFVGTCLAVASVACGHRKDAGWTMRAIALALAGAAPALFFGLVGIADL